MSEPWALGARVGHGDNANANLLVGLFLGELAA
jgi:hypothetical protein